MNLKHILLKSQHVSSWFVGVFCNPGLQGPGLQGLPCPQDCGKQGWGGFNIHKLDLPAAGPCGNTSSHIGNLPLCK
jgi:hypothetical protein